LKEAGSAMRVYAPGIYPRSEELIQATRDLDRERTTPEAVEEQLQRDFRELVAVQERAGLDLLSDGMLRWQDLFRPLAEASQGLEARPLTRFLDTNTFYRALIVDGEPRLREPLAAPDLPAGRWLATLPSPFAFAHAANGALTAAKAAEAVIGPQIEEYDRAGAARVVLMDPFVARHDGVEEAVAALRELPDGVSYVLHVPFGDASGLVEDLADAPVDAVGIDFYGTPLDAIPQDFPKEIAAGVVDSRSSALESPEEIAAFAEQLRERGPAGLSLTVNGDLQFVPERIAREKLALLGRARDNLREGVPA
jgi:5-methyltetrahydropteroyltriglutamate--homocysteine methyltransferase